MGELVDRLKADVRIKESLNACIHCGTCTAICPAASFYDYDPRELTATVQEIASKNNDHQLTELLRSDYIWYCGECMSCKTRCPRDNTPELLLRLYELCLRILDYLPNQKRGDSS
jgi:heterodisulfide reductase subunit C1